MVSAEVAVLAVLLSLLVFAWIAVRSWRTRGDVEGYIVARNSQDGLTLGLNFLASGMGAWILFAPPEVGAFVGLWGVLGYALAAAAPIAAFAVLGRRMRRVVPEGHTLTEFVLHRFGRPFQLYVVAVTLAYMFIFVTAELTAIGAVTTILSGADARIAIVLVAAITFGYTAYGGFKASLRTDYWQAWLLVGLLLVGAAAIVLDMSDPAGAFTDSGLLALDRTGIEVAITLVIAVTAANLFHQGYWQRVWSARDDDSLSEGALIGVLTTMPVVAIVGVLGIIAVGGGFDIGAPPVPFFALVSGLPAWVGVVVLVLGAALVASSVDTLVSGISALIATEQRRISLGGARVLTMVLLVPAAVIAFEGYSVLRLFLVADLLAAATVVPTLLGLWDRATTRGALAGSAAGLVGAVAYNLIDTGSLEEALRLATFPGGTPTIEPFVGALVFSTVVALAVAVWQKETTDLEAVGRRISELTPEEQSSAT